MVKIEIHLPILYGNIDFFQILIKKKHFKHFGEGKFYIKI
jgi:hypothetical protein